MKTPIRKFPEHKRSFLPSKSEAQKVSKLVHALKMGWIKTRAEQEKLRAKKEPQFYMLWQTDDQPEEMRRIHKHIPAPKRHLPGHAESYNPPPEYLFDAKELKQWNKLKNEPSKRKLHFVPQKYDSLRKVPAYPRYIKERFLRCLDLYLCPRAIKMKLQIEPEALVPKLPSPKDLQPFPNVLAMEFKSHSDMVRSITVDKSGQFLLSGSDDCTVKIWEVNTGRCLKTIEMEGVVRSVEWCPNSALSLVLVAAGNKVHLLNPNVGDFLVCSKTDGVLKEMPKSDVIINERVRSTVQWDIVENENKYEHGFRITLSHFKEVKWQSYLNGNFSINFSRSTTFSGDSSDVACQRRLFRDRYARGPEPLHPGVPDISPTFPAALHEIQGSRPVRPVPSHETFPFRRDSTPRAHLRPHETDAGQKTVDQLALGLLDGGPSTGR